MPPTAADSNRERAITAIKMLGGKVEVEDDKLLGSKRGRRSKRGRSSFPKGDRKRGQFSGTIGP